MGIFSWFGKSAAPDYETLLSRLASDVHEAKVHLSEIRLRQRRFSLLINLYGLALWGVWAGLWWIGGLPFGLVGWDSNGTEAKAIGVAGVLLGPVFITIARLAQEGHGRGKCVGWMIIYALGRLHGFYFARQRRYEENNLRKLLAEQKKQVDAIKKATNYDATRKLIEEYDVANGPNGPAPMTPQGARGGSKAGTPQRRSPQAQALAQAQAQQGPRTPQNQIAGKGVAVPGIAQAQAAGTPRAPGHLLGAGGTPMPAGMSAEQAAMLHFQPQPVLPTPEKRWYDRVVDSILGEDPSHATQSKFALVCGECFRHNGLVGSKYEWERMQWICPRCNHLNPAPLSRAPAAQIDASAAGGVSTPAGLGRITAPNVATPGTPSRTGPGISGTNGGAGGPQTRARRQLGASTGDSGNGNGTPRGSRLRQQVMVDDEDEGVEGDGGKGASEDGRMEIDE